MPGVPDRRRMEGPGFARLPRGRMEEALMMEVKTIDKPDERRDFPQGHLEALHLTGLDFAVATFEPAGAGRSRWAR